MTGVKPQVLVVIPARYGSSRFPGKPLVMLGRKSLIQLVYEQAASCRSVKEVLVATDDERIRDAVERFGGRAVMVAGDYRTGTDRVAAVARTVPGEYFVNLQGDEIPATPALLEDLIEPFLGCDAEMGTLKRAMDTEHVIENPAVVKVVTDSQGYALYFSRAPIPLVRDGIRGQVVSRLHYLHLGLYIYRREALLRFAGWPTSQLEDAEKLEQLRALQQGMRIRVWETSHLSLRVDTPEDAVGVADKLKQYESQKQDLPVGKTVSAR
ncbi:MAG: 3-deoxy-manno-octulosonate cytidylyltransferase [Nitrospira sp.]|nr:3-deoxy-manno-octulosonate cytidylyltransferase [Nitrospira sp.]